MTDLQGLEIAMKEASCVRLQNPVTFARKMRHLHFLESRLLGHTVVLENFQELNLGALCPRIQNIQI
jgi:hypothetical protein